jgi:hypothetical protein
MYTSRSGNGVAFGAVLPCQLCRRGGEVLRTKVFCQSNYDRRIRLSWRLLEATWKVAGSTWKPRDRRAESKWLQLRSK